jgi:hypothetical protein
MLQVRYRTLEQLDDVVARLERGPKIEASEPPADTPPIRQT